MKLLSTVTFLSAILVSWNASANINPPPRNIMDLVDILQVPVIGPTANLAPICNGREKDGGWVRRFKQYLTIYQPLDRIDTNQHPLGNWNFKYGFQLYEGIAKAELRRGNLADAELSQRKFISLVPSGQKGKLVSAYAQLARIQIARGDIEGAEQSLQKSENWHAKKALNKPRKRNIRSSWIARAKGDLSQAKGQLAAAESFYREALNRHIQHKPHAAEVAISHSKLAEIIAAQGRFLEAETEARLAIAHLIKYQRANKVGTAQSIYRLARVLVDQERFEEAESAARSAIGVYQKKCSPADSVEFAEARRTLAEILSLQGRYDEALILYQAIESALGDKRLLFENRFANDLTLSYAMIHDGDYERAFKRLQKTVKTFDDIYGKDHPLSAEARGFLAIAEWKLGSKNTARKTFMEVLEILQDPRKRAGVRPHNLRIIMQTYLDMLANAASIDDETMNTLFEISEALRNSTVQQSINAMGARAAIDSPKLAELLRKEQDLRLQITALETTLSHALAEKINVDTLQKTVLEYRKNHTRIMTRILDDFPEYGDLIKPSPVDLGGVKNILENNEVFIATYSTEKKTYIWTITRDEPVLLTRVDYSAEQLRELVSTLRRALEPEVASLTGIVPFDVKLAHQLYSKILEPGKFLWENRDTMIFSLHGALGHLPMSVLPVKDQTLGSKSDVLFSNYRDIPFLIKTHAIINLPSAGALAAIRAIPARQYRPQRLLGIGDPWFNSKHVEEASILAVNNDSNTDAIGLRAAPALKDNIHADIGMLPRLPETAQELYNIADILGREYKSDIFLGTEANEKNIKSIDLEAFEIIAFATHGLIPGDLDGLTQPALALTAPDISKVEGDGLLTMDEIMNLKLDADWVILSACNTGSSDGDEASEAISGLGRAFFYAGARALLVSNWPVETNSALELTTGIFKAGKHEKNRAKALQSSMVEMIRSGEAKSAGRVLYTYAHPIFWAPFTLVGDYLEKSTIASKKVKENSDLGGFNLFSDY